MKPDRLILEMAEESYQAELSLRDLYLVMRKWSRLLFALPLAFALVTLVVSFLWAKSFSSKAVVSVVSKESGNPILANLPSVAVLTNSFKQLLTTTALSQFDEKTLEKFESKYDDKQGLWTLKAQAGSAAEAKQKADALFHAAQEFMQNRSMQIVGTNISTNIAQAQVDLDGQIDSLKKLREAMLDKGSPANGGGVVSATLEGVSVNPLSARAGNPGAANLSLDESKLRSGIAQSRAGIEKLRKLQKDPEKLKALLAQALNLQVLVAPAEPRRADFPRPFLFTVMAAVLGLLIALVWTFLMEAIQEPQVH